jgi:hypothetical protein
MEVGLSIVVLFTTFYLWSGIAGICRKKKRKKIKDFGIEADATVLTIYLAYAKREQNMFKSQIRVEPLTGRNYIVELRIDQGDYDGHLLKAGSKILIKYLPADRKKVVLLKVLSEN